MALSHAILASLIGGKPCSGYDLAKQFNSSLGHFWKATHQQIYRELARLESQDMVISELVPQDDRPDKKVYRVTDRGKEYLLDWVSKPSPPIMTKVDLLAKFHIGYLAPPEDIFREIKTLKKRHEDSLVKYRELEKKLFDNPESLSLKAKFRYLNLKMGINYEEAWIDWIDEALNLLGGNEKGGDDTASREE